MLRVAVALMIAAFSTPALAWNDFGHMVVARIAWGKLTSAERARADDLLKHNPQYNDWIKEAPAGQGPEWAFARAATWPDFIKSARGYRNDRDLGSPVARQNLGYVDKLQHRYWHFVDYPFATDGTPLQNPETPNAETQIIALRQAVSKTSNLGDSIKSYDLVWLLHLVGDVHQPLHATARFSRANPNGDQGGNLVQVSRCSCTGTLHSFWDGAVGKNDPLTLDRIRAKANQIATRGSVERASTDVRGWIQESFGAAQRVAYAEPVQSGSGTVDLGGSSSTYSKNAYILATQRAALAGDRLARLLHDAWR